MKTNDLKEDKLISSWLSGIRASKNTRDVYLLGMQAYTEFTKMTPKELITEAEADVRAGMLMRERNIFSYLPEFREHIENKGVAPLTVKSRMTAVLSFYNSCQIDLPVLPKSLCKARPQVKRKKIPPKEDILHVLKHSDLLERAIILAGVSSGLAANEISNLKIGNYREGYDDKTKITTLHIVRKNVDYEFITAISPEATEAVDSYLSFRNRKGENHDKLRVVSNDDYLFVGRRIPDGYLTYYDKNKSPEKNVLIREEMRKLDSRSIIKNLMNL